MANDANKVYNDLCTHLTACGWKYDRHDDDKVITLNMRGDDLPIEMILFVKEKQQVVSLISPIRPKAPEDKRIDAAVAVNVANYGIVFGSFDYDVSDGEIRWRAVLPYRDAAITKDQVNYLVVVSAGTIDKYNDKFLMLNKGMMTLEQFIASENAE
ncbi:MAG: YbjN domain-containing protein [Oscillospiraceae bacterium]|nr:YbjN domain-containing protein [Oscillospiraceae bacterium]